MLVEEADVGESDEDEDDDRHRKDGRHLLISKTQEQQYNEGRMSKISSSILQLAVTIVLWRHTRKRGVY